jgi:hypothetical protein
MTVSELQRYTAPAEHGAGNYTTVAGAGVPSVAWPRGKVGSWPHCTLTLLTTSAGTWRFVSSQLPVLG